MNNTTDHLDNDHHHDHENEHHQYYLMVVLMLYLGPVFVFNLALMAAIIIERTVPAPVRFLLANIVAASELVVMGLAIVFLHNVIVTEVLHLEESDELCHVSYVILTSACAARFLFMAAYAITIYVLIRKTVQTQLKLWPILVAGIALWFVATAPNTWLFSNFVQSTFHDNAFCASHPTNSFGFIYSFGYIIFYGGGSITIAVLFPILAYCYVKRNSVDTSPIITQAMVKFTLFLLVGNAINFFGISIPILFASFAPNDEDHIAVEQAFTYVEGILLMASLIPTPVIIIVFFDTIRKRLIAPFRLVCKHHKTFRSSSSTSNVNNTTVVDLNCNQPDNDNTCNVTTDMFLSWKNNC